MSYRQTCIECANVIRHNGDCKSVACYPCGRIQKAEFSNAEGMSDTNQGCGYWEWLNANTDAHGQPLS